MDTENKEERSPSLPKTENEPEKEKGSFELVWSAAEQNEEHKEKDSDAEEIKREVYA